MVDIASEASHAGSMPVDEHRSILVAASEFVVDIRTAAGGVAQSQSSTIVRTVGQFGVAPNACNIVPGGVTLQVDIRDVDYRAMNTITERAEAVLGELEVAHPVKTGFDHYRDQRPSRVVGDCVATTFAAAVTEDVDAKRMHSAAMYDTMNVANVTDAALLFTPSAGGLLHNLRKWTDWADCAITAPVLAGTLIHLTGT